MRSIIVTFAAPPPTLRRLAGSLLTMIDDLVLNGYESHCEKCGHLVAWKTPETGEFAYDLTHTFCASDFCLMMRCANCRAEWASLGPISCPSCQVGNKPEKIKKLRREYRRKSR